jgi:hypothetical protein
MKLTRIYRFATAVFVVGAGFVWFYTRSTSDVQKEAESVAATESVQSRSRLPETKLEMTGLVKNAPVTESAPVEKVTITAEAGLTTFPDPAKVGPYTYPDTVGMAGDGEVAVAKITVSDKTFTQSPNQQGHFGMIFVPPSARATIAISYPDAKSGERVTFQAMDGGVIEGAAHEAKLDSARAATATLATTEYPGLFRVLVQKGIDRKVVQIWVGAPLPVRSSL